MALPRVIQGVYASDNREVVYCTYCQHCKSLVECKKRRAPVPGCETVGDVEFRVGGKGKVGWSGVITLKKIVSIAKEYLESEPPADVAMPAVQTEMEFEI